MANEPVIVSNKCYSSKKIISSLQLYKDCFDKFSVGFDSAVSLDNELPIFIDTSVLLRYYEISFAARKKLFDFIERNQKRIVISSQVQYEFLKNREDVIQRFFEQVTKQIPKDFTSDIMNKMESFSNSNKEVLIDYPFMKDSLAAMKNQLKDLLQKLNEAVKKNGENPIDLIMVDEYLNLLNGCIPVDELLTEEIFLVRKDFDALKKDLAPEKISTFLNKSSNAFPGAGDIKDKPEEPYGDFIIYHEMMKYMELKKTDLIFLTFDNAKGDWMTKEKLPHFHYVTNMYANTSQILFIINAERTLKEVLDVNIESLVVSETSEKAIEIKQITFEKLKNYIEHDQIFGKLERSRPTKRLLNEITLNGYKSIRDLDEDLRLAKDAITHMNNRATTPIKNIYGFIRIGMRLTKASQGLSASSNEPPTMLTDEEMEMYKDYSHLVLPF